MAKRGTLKVYLGFAPGVGKTCAMLSEAHDLVDRGHDVLVGIVEDHGRARTRKLTEGLPILQRKSVAHRGSEYGEFDLQAALDARPEIILVDELAHTVVDQPDRQVELSAGTKRWHDVYALLEAGINVISTMNIQHLESLNDVVSAVTGTRQRETVPDQVLRDADEIELIDLSPDALRIRLARGEVYRQQQAETALNSYFRVGNLTALRELSLLWLADKVDEGLEKYREEEKIEDNWPARERVVVAVQGDEASEALIRRGARITERVVGREMLVVYVSSADATLGRNLPQRLRRLQELTESLDGQWRVIEGDDVADTLLKFARTVNASQLVIGLGTRMSRLFSSTAHQIIDGADRIDVHIVSTIGGDSKEEAEGLGLWSKGRTRASAWLKSLRSRAAGTSKQLSPMRKVSGWALAVLGPVLLTLLMLPFDNHEAALGSILLGYLTIAVFSAMAGGFGPAIMAVTLGSLLANWFFTHPFRTLTVTEPANFVQIILFFVISVAVAVVVDIAERRRALANRRLGQAVVLSDLARGALDEGDDIRSLLSRLRETFNLHRVDLQQYSKERKKWVTMETTDPGGIGVPWPGIPSPAHVGAGDGMRFVLGERELSPAENAMIEAHGARITAIIDRERIEAMRRATAALEAGNRVGTALLTAVSHDLRTPLAGIQAAISSLMMDDLDLDEDSRALLMGTIESSVDRLETVTGNLLDMGRVNSNTVTIRHTSVQYADVVDAVCAELPEAAQHIDSDVGESAPAVVADAGLVQRIVSNIVINARRYAPNSRIEITAHPVQESGTVELHITDHGPGFPPETVDDVFTPFQRLGDQSASTNGLGLGLAVARGFAEAMGGALVAENTPGGGATLVLSLPAATTPPTTNTPPATTTPSGTAGPSTAGSARRKEIRRGARRGVERKETIDHEEATEELSGESQ
ncbi:sensor histidine kinase [Corynebacterium kroppenstedtii]|jgi:two-component system sensor kinase kdpD|uniref:histidine kinase n=1 Tax=Corynebacterium kroppenstedtii TaxID=161879 RepID=A0A2W5STW4_9CORY|nr:ATP-binding protein [Corynebacterium kroppenstedtii]MDU7286635.1 DUF4118 domain-containing protein [Corynebacterium kroppenstedtii]PZR05087.1 MAG: sensor histidine kinase [Corynebacterium kroppenstedtii]